MASSVNDTPFQLSNGVHNFCISGYPIGDNCRPNLSDGMQSSWRMGIRNAHDSSFESPGHVEQPDSDSSEAKNVMPVSHMAVRPGKKGTCYRCLKGNRFTEKEVCIVCGAKYCSNCVLWAMGSMPEGRKCFTCIGQRIDESKRKTLGKCSSMLKLLLSEFEVKQIMNSEKLCEINQLPPELVYVNGDSLSRSEISILQTCPNPPKKLKPGRYWYDRESGFWGKEGEKPGQIISPHMNVGGHMKKDASNGNTNIFINNREITKTELLWLQWVGVKCEVTTYFWLSADGRYQEEGANAIEGNIWDKQRAKAICAILSLPTPPASSSFGGEKVNAVSPNNLEQKILLLVGYENSGTTTISNQAKILYKVPFTEEERYSVKRMIQINLFSYLGTLLKGRETFEEECLRTTYEECSPSENAGQINQKTIYSINPRLEAFSDWLLKEMVSGNLKRISSACIPEYAPLIENLWKDPAIRATYDRMSELKLLPLVAKYYLERAVAVTIKDYQPSQLDILCAEESASSKWLSSSRTEFSFPKFVGESRGIYYNQHNPLLRYKLIRVHQSFLGGNCELSEPFDDVHIVLFCVSLIDYDEFEDTYGFHTNKMIASRRLFQTIVTHPNYKEREFLLILNKYDLFEEKIEQVPLTRCEWFHDFNPVIYHESIGRSTIPSLAQRAFHYIAVKFKRWFRSLTNKKLYVSPVAGLEPDSVDEALRYAREILEWEEELSLLNYDQEYSLTSDED